LTEVIYKLSYDIIKAGGLKSRISYWFLFWFTRIGIR